MANNKQNIDPNILLIGGGLFLAYIAGRSILEKLGIVSTAAEHQQEQQQQLALEQLRNQNYFDPDYYKQQSGALVLTVSAATRFAKIIYDAKGIINDDEAAVYGVFQAFKTKSQISFLSEIFFKTYKKSLIGYLDSFLNTNEIASIAKICNKLPNFKI